MEVRISLLYALTDVESARRISAECGVRRHLRGISTEWLDRRAVRIVRRRRWPTGKAGVFRGFGLRFRFRAGVVGLRPRFVRLVRLDRDDRLGDRSVGSLEGGLGEYILGVLEFDEVRPEVHRGLWDVVVQDRALPSDSSSIGGSLSSDSSYYSAQSILKF